MSLLWTTIEPDDRPARRPVAGPASGRRAHPAVSLKRSSARTGTLLTRLKRHVAIAIARCPPAREEKESSRRRAPRDRVPSRPIVPSRPSWLPSSNPDGGRSRLLSRQPRASTDAVVDTHAVSGTDVTVLSQRLPLRPAKQWLRRGQIGRCCNSSIPEARDPCAPTPPLPRERKRTRLQAVADRASDRVAVRRLLRGPTDLRERDRARRALRRARADAVERRRAARRRPRHPCAPRRRPPGSIAQPPTGRAALSTGTIVPVTDPSAMRAQVLV